MDKEWLLTLPDLKDYLEIRPLDYYYNQDKQKIDFAAYGTSPENLYLGTVILYQHRSNPNLFLRNYLLKIGQESFYLEWWEGKEMGEIYGAALRYKENDWRIKDLDEITVWDTSFVDEKTAKDFHLHFSKIYEKPVSEPKDPEENWLLNIPEDFPENWIEEDRRDFYFNSGESIQYCPINSSPEKLRMGFVIVYRHKYQKNHLLYVYHRLREKNSFMLRWCERDQWEVCGAAIFHEAHNTWRIKKPCEGIFWHYPEGTIFPYYPIFRFASGSVLFDLN